MAEFRWTLLGLGVLLIACIWWWGTRRSRHLPGNAQLRETSGAPSAAPSVASFVATKYESDASCESRAWGVPPFEPLSIHTAHFEEVDALDSPMSANAGPLEVPFEPEPEPQPQPGALVEDAAAVESTPPDEERIVTLRICAVGAAPWSGDELLTALGNQALSFGRYKVFHRKDNDGRTLFCAASLIEPGTFDLERMPHETYRGLTLFAVLPGPLDASTIIDVLIATAHELAEALQGAVQDAKGAPFSPQTADALRNLS